ncbi:MAG: DUF4838 domain-containing protein, partial [Candidatus Scalindua sp.]
MKKSAQNRILIGLFLVLSTSSFIQCSQKEKSQFSEEEWASLPADGPYLLAYDRIICSSEATKPELYAASEFQRLFKAFTGKELTIVNTDSQSGKIILIGADATASAGLQATTEKLGEEGFNIDISRDKLAIYGGRPRGTLYGVYEFFEQYCGVRYLTHDHTFYPTEGKDKDFRIKGRNYSYVPPFAFRWSYYGETNRNPTFAAQLHTNTVSGAEELGGITGYKLVSHNVAYLVPPSIYGKEHPEYYALVNGQRMLNMHGGGPQLCMTNQEVLEIVIKATIDAIEKNPNIKNFNVAQMDNGNYCTCESCAAIDAREESHAAATLAFVNAVAERIEKTHPEVFIGTYAYQYTRKPPKTMHARDNVLIQLCSIEACVLHAIDDPSCSRNQGFIEDMDGWKDKTKNIFIWHYNTNFMGYLLPFPNLRSIGKSVEYYANNNGRGIFMQAAGNGFSTELSDLRNYVMSRCIWKPGRDSWQEAMEFCRLHYAESAQPIIDYLTYYHDLIEKENLHPDCFPTEASLYLNSETVKRIDKYFAEALVLAQSEEVRSRVEKASLCAYRAKLSVATMDLKYENGICKPSLENVDENLLERYTELCTKYNVSMDNENVKNDTYLNNMRKIYSGMTAVRLENEFWRVLVLPESNAKIVEMTYKPTGRDVIQPTRSLSRFRFEEWIRQGDGPKAFAILAYKIIENSPTKTVIGLTTKDGSQIERTISLAGNAIHFETLLKAKEARAFDFLIHPEYDAGSGSDDPEEVSIYVKAKEWIHANQSWVKAKPTYEQSALIKEGLKGGSFAYFNQKAGFGVEQRFEPGSFEDLMLYWNPTRFQINLEMIPTVKNLKAGEQ